MFQNKIVQTQKADLIRTLSKAKDQAEGAHSLLANKRRDPEETDHASLVLFHIDSALELLGAKSAEIPS